MAKRTIGERVGAICGLDEDKKGVIFFGYGQYAGHQLMDESVPGFMAEAIRGCKLETPTILLDSGEKVWGCECWWGGEEKIQETIRQYEADGLEIRTILPSEYRKKYLISNDEVDHATP